MKPRPAPDGRPGEPARARRPTLLELDRGLVTALLFLQVALYFFWTVTQFESLPRWQPLFHRTGPVVLPLMFLNELVLLAAAAPLAWRERRRLLQHPAAILLALAVALGALTVPLAYLHHFQTVKIWKDVAFLLGYLVVPVILLLSRAAARRLFFLFIALGFAAGAVGLVTAIQVAHAYGQPPAEFLLWTYRVFAGGQFNEMVILFGTLTMVLTASGLRRRWDQVVLLAAYAVALVRYRFYLTRLYWIAIALTLPLVLAALYPRRALRAALSLAVLAGALFIALTPVVNAFGHADLSTRFANNGPDVSVNFRAIESRLLLERVRALPLTGWGPGGTISPNMPEEPARNNTSSFFDGYLGIAYKFGLPVLGLIVAAVAAALWRIRRQLKTSLSPIDLGILGGAGTYLVAVLVATPAQDLVFANFSALPLGLMMGVAVRLGRPDVVEARGAAPRAGRTAPQRSIAAAATDA